MEEINLKDLFSYFISKIWIVIITFLLLVIISIINCKFIKVPEYNSTTTIVLTINNESNTDTSISQNDITINQKLVATYRQIIKSRRVLDQVINNLGLDVDASELSKKISVTNETDTELLKITVSNVDPELAKDIADEIAKVFSEEIVDIYNIKNVSIIDTALVAEAPYNIGLLKNMVIFGILGIMLGLGIIFIMFYFDTTVKSGDEITEKLNLPVLGIVPAMDNGKNLKSRRKSEKKRGA